MISTIRTIIISSSSSNSWQRIAGALQVQDLGAKQPWVVRMALGIWGSVLVLPVCLVILLAGGCGSGGKGCHGGPDLAEPLPDRLVHLDREPPPLVAIPRVPPPPPPPPPGYINPPPPGQDPPQEDSSPLGRAAKDVVEGRADLNQELERLEDGTFRVGAVVVDREKNEMRFPGEVNMVEGIVEYMAVGPRGKTHESVLVFHAEGIHLQLGCILLGLEQVPMPEQQDPSMKVIREGRDQPDPAPPPMPGKDGEVSAGAVAGAAAIWVEWDPVPVPEGVEDEHGEDARGVEGADDHPDEHTADHRAAIPGEPERDREQGQQQHHQRKRVRLEDLAWNRQQGRPMEPAPWMFTGSVVWEGHFVAQYEQSFVATWPDRGAIFNTPVHSQNPYRGDFYGFEANKRRLPPVGTPVTVIIRTWEQEP